ncbi:MAG: mechanosensitive ion channel [Longimicrobiales bacterium]|nr:mechanosensitive ion channel [Longimicrobiales bacterium]
MIPRLLLTALLVLAPPVPVASLGSSPARGHAGAVQEAPDSAAVRQEAPDSALVADSTIAILERRLAELEASNDSLRNTILGLVALQAAGAQRRAQPADSAGTPAEILGRGAREVRHWGVRIVLTLIFLAAVAGLIRALVWVLERLAERNAKRRLAFKRLVPVSRILIWALAFPFAGLVILNFDAQGLVAAGAAVGVAVGFAAQDILKNIFGGIIVLFDQPFQVGDKISVHGTYGEVVNIGLRSTRLVTPDDNLVTVPNAQVVGDQVANANAGELNCQVVTELHLPGWADEAEARRLAFQAAVSSPYVYLNKPVVVLVEDAFDKAFYLRLKVKAYVLDPRHEFAFRSDVTLRARAAFREAGLLAADGTGIREGDPAPVAEGGEAES